MRTQFFSFRVRHLGHHNRPENRLCRIRFGGFIIGDQLCGPQQNQHRLSGSKTATSLDIVAFAKAFGASPWFARRRDLLRGSLLDAHLNRKVRG